MIVALLNRFDDKNDRTAKTKNNIVLSFAVKGGSIIVNLLLVSLTLKYLNISEYGIWLTLSSVLSWLSFFDIGLGQGLRNKFAEAVAVNNKVLAREYVSTTYAVLTVLTILIWLSFYYLCDKIPWNSILNAKENDKQFNDAVFVLFTFFLFQFVLKVINSILLANQQVSTVSLFDLFSNCLIFICIYGSMKLGFKGSIYNVSFVSGTAPIVTLMLAHVWFYSKTLKEFTPSIRYINLNYTRELLGVGVKFFVVQITAIALFQSTNIILTQTLGPNYVSIYNIVFKYYSLLIMITNIVVNPLWSAFTEAYVKQDFKWMNSVLNKINYYFYVIVVISIVMVFLSNTVYRIWIDKDFDVSVEISIAMTINSLLIVRWNTYVALINGTGKISLQLLMNCIVSILFIPLAIKLTELNGLIGMILANISVNLIYAIVLPIQAKKVFSQKASGIWSR
jgi:O-antigen/teichoic acid export membrane protein